MTETCKVVNGKCESGADIGHFVKCYRCDLNPKSRSVNISMSFPDYQLILDLCKIDDFNPNEALSRIMKSGIEHLKLRNLQVS